MSDLWLHPSLILLLGALLVLVVPGDSGKKWLAFGVTLVNEPVFVGHDL